MKNPQRKEGTSSFLWRRLEEQATRMRKAPTDAEARLWQELRSGKLDGLKFRRQHAVGRFIVDFYCVSANLVVEVDGPVHDLQAEADEVRQAYLESLGLRFLRFTNDDVLSDTATVVAEILKAAQE